MVHLNGGNLRGFNKGTLYKGVGTCREMNRRECLTSELGWEVGNGY